MMECDRLRDDRLDVLYGEADASTRRRVEEHLASCGACREELTGLKRLRQDLRAWTLPESRGPAFVAPRRASLWLPLAAGFLLALGVGLGWSGAELRYDDRGLGVRLGRTEPALQAALAEQEARALARDQAYRREIAGLKAALASGLPGPVSGHSGDDQAVLARVAEMIKESEARQGARLETTLARFDRKEEAQRRYDLARIAAGLSYLDGKNGQHVARTTELMGYVLDAAHPR